MEIVKNLQTTVDNSPDFVLKLKKHFEDLVRDEFTYDANEEKLFLN
jgi:hypothetical protein